MKKILGLFLLLLLTMPLTAQVVKIPLFIDDANTFDTLYFGADPTATDGIDVSFGETNLPPFPPAGVFEARWLLPENNFSGSLSSDDDYRAGSVPLNTSFEYRMQYQLSGTGSVININVTLPSGVTMRLQDVITGSLIDVTLNSSNGTYQVTNPNSFNKLKVTITYSNYAPSSPGPLFSSNKASVAFGTVQVGVTKQDSVVISNPGTTNALILDSIRLGAGVYSITPSPSATFPLTIAAGSNYKFLISFAPDTALVFADTVKFYTNIVSPSVYTLPLSGTGLSQGGIVKFKNASRTVLHGARNVVDTLILDDYVGNKLQAGQFTLVIPEKVQLKTIQRGNSLPLANFQFNQHIKRGNLTPSGTTIDTAIVVFLANDTSYALPAGDYNLAIVTYDVADIAVEDTVTIKVTNVVGGLSSPFAGQSANLTVDSLYYVIITKRSTVGDITGDGTLDIVDLLMVLDNILELITFTPSELLAADIAPWGAPDGVINVLDLALLQDIILKGVLPNGTPINKPVIVKNESGNSTFGKVTNSETVDVKVYVSKNNITVKVRNNVEIKGIQLELNNIETAGAITGLITAFGEAHYFSAERKLRMLVYDNAGALLLPGEHTIVRFDASIRNENSVTVNKLIIVNSQYKTVESKIELFHGEDADLPAAYNLEQNYPNPFNPSTKIVYQVPENLDLKLKIYDMQGQEIRTLVNGFVNQGTYEINWDGKNNAGVSVPSGIYLYRLESRDFVSTKKMTLLK